jgi:hypothetical protein
VTELQLPLAGGCLCGAVRFEVTEPPLRTGYCHCTRCQRRTGTAAAVSSFLAPGSLRILAGAEHVRCWTPPDGFAKCFCELCGGALWSRHPEREDSYAVRLGAFDGDPGLRPEYRQYVAYAAAWEPMPEDGLPRHPERRPA